MKPTLRNTHSNRALSTTPRRLGMKPTRVSYPNLARSSDPELVVIGSVCVVHCVFQLGEKHNVQTKISLGKK